MISEKEVQLISLIVCCVVSSCSSPQVKIKEMMLIMGFRPKLFWLGWLLTAFAFALPMLLLTIIVGSFTFWRAVSAAFYIFTVFGFVLAGVTFCFVMYSAFNKAIYGSCAARVLAVCVFR
jgi:ABC-type Na+ efflux pump permease subunit